MTVERDQSNPKDKAAFVALSYDDVRTLVIDNNKSALSTELLVCQIWKESSFNPNANNGSHRGLMQMSSAAVDYVNANTPSGTHYEFSEMYEPAKNIQCGTWYLRKLMEHNPTWSIKTTLEHFGTGSGYADNILICEQCIQADPMMQQSCRNAIHS
jgi:hypothetical protein